MRSGEMKEKRKSEGKNVGMENRGGMKKKID